MTYFTHITCLQGRHGGQNVCDTVSICVRVFFVVCRHFVVPAQTRRDVYG